MAANIRIKNLPEGYQSIITNGKHSIIGDEPIASKGTDLGLSPTELVLSGLALCKARKNRWRIGNVEATLSQEVNREPNGLRTSVKVHIDIDGEITEDQKVELLKQEIIVISIECYKVSGILSKLRSLS